MGRCATGCRQALGIVVLALVMSACGAAIAAGLTGQDALASAAKTPGPGVADLLGQPPPPGQTVEIDAYFSGAIPVPFSGGPRPPKDEVVCPRLEQVALTDRPFLPALYVLNSACGNAPPADAAWLVAVTPAMTEPGVRRVPQLPYHGRLRGHLGNPAFSHCAEAGRIFTVEAVVEVYEQGAPAAPPYQLPADYALWPRYHDAALGYSLPYPGDWRVERWGATTLALRAPDWPRYPVTVQVYPGQTFYDEDDPLASASWLRRRGGGGPFQQGWSFQWEVPGSQHLAGDEVLQDVTAQERRVAALFSAHGRTYELALCYPLGFEAPQPLLTAYTAIVEGFRLDQPPGP